jgi:hypothetical protein
VASSGEWLEGRRSSGWSGEGEDGTVGRRGEGRGVRADTWNVCPLNFIQDGSESSFQLNYQ